MKPGVSKEGQQRQGQPGLCEAGGVRRRSLLGAGPQSDEKHRQAPPEDSLDVHQEFRESVCENLHPWSWVYATASQATSYTTTSTEKSPP